MRWVQLSPNFERVCLTRSSDGTHLGHSSPKHALLPQILYGSSHLQNQIHGPQPGSRALPHPSALPLLPAHDLQSRPTKGLGITQAHTTLSRLKALEIAAPWHSLPGKTFLEI